MFENPTLVYLLSFALMLPCLLLAGWASARVHSVYNKDSAMHTQSDWTASDAARMLLEKNNVLGVQVVRGKGRLTDNFNPANMTVTLSESTYDSASVAAVAVAAHEIGHVVQREEGYLFYRLRTVLVPITNFGTRLALPLVIIGLLLEWLLQYSEIGNIVVFVGVCLYALSTVFLLVTLPVELDASRRAKAMLCENGVITTADERAAASKVLGAAAMTYVASLLTSLVFFLRFLAFVLMFSRRK